MELSRRGLLGGFGALIAAPYVVRNSGLLMPVRNQIEVPLILAHGLVGDAHIGGSYGTILPPPLYPGEVLNLFNKGKTPTPIHGAHGFLQQRSQSLLSAQGFVSLISDGERWYIRNSHLLNAA